MAQEQDHVVITVTVKRVTFEEVKVNGDPRNVNRTERKRVVGDVLSASVTGSTVEKARTRTLVVLGAIDDESPSTAFKHAAMRGESE